jgi:hypothetical protein
MSQGNVQPTFLPRIDANAGVIDIAISRPAASSGASTTSATNSWLLASVSFIAVSPGQSQIAISGSAVTSAGQAISIQFVPASVVVR